MGRKRFYNLPEKTDPDYKSKMSSIERQGKNTPIQGANAGRRSRSPCRNIYNLLPAYQAQIVNTVHDEIVVEVVELRPTRLASTSRTKCVRPVRCSSQSSLSKSAW